MPLDLRFPHRDHLRRAEDFQRLRRDGRAVRHPALMMSWMPNNLPHNRYGFIVSKQVGNAVIRNRIRRLARESVRQRRGRIAAGYDIVFIARQPIAGQPFASVDRIVDELMVRAGLFVDRRPPG